MAEVLTLDQFVKNLKAFAKDIETNGIKVAEKKALTGFSLVKERIQREGFGANYSDKYIPAYFLRGKELNAKGKKYLEDDGELDDDLVNWKGFRKAQGLQVGFVDLTYSGRMLGGMRVINKITKKTTFIVHIGGTDKEVDQKLAWNVKRYGDFLATTSEENAELDELVRDEFEEMKRRNGL